MGMRLYPLPGGDGDGDETKVWYPLGLGTGMWMNFFCGNGYGIAKPVPAPPRCHPYLLGPNWHVPAGKRPTEEITDYMIKWRLCLTHLICSLQKQNVRKVYLSNGS